MNDTLVLAVGGRTWAVASALPVAASWRRWAPPYIAVEAGRQGVADVTVIRRALGPVSGGRELVLHGEMAGRARDEDGTWVVRNLAIDAEYRWSVRRGLVLSYGPGVDDDTAALDAFRVVRGVVCAAAEVGEWTRAHMAVVTCGGVAVAFVGDKGAGKTSFSMSLLDAPGDVGFITNDKAQVAPNGDGDGVVVRGLPLAAAIGIGSLGALSAVAVEEGSRVIDGKLYLWPQDLCARVGKPCVAVAPLRMVIACALDLEASGVEVAPMPEDVVAAMIDGPVSSYSDRINPSWLIERVVGVVPSGAPVELARLPWYRASGNPWDGAWPGVFQELVHRTTGRG